MKLKLKRFRKIPHKNVPYLYHGVCELFFTTRQLNLQLFDVRLLFAQLFADVAQFRVHFPFGTFKFLPSLLLFDEAFFQIGDGTLVFNCQRKLQRLTTAVNQKVRLDVPLSLAKCLAFSSSSAKV